MFEVFPAILNNKHDTSQWKCYSFIYPQHIKFETIMNVVQISNALSVLTIRPH